VTAAVPLGVAQALQPSRVMNRLNRCQGQVDDMARQHDSAPELARSPAH